MLEIFKEHDLVEEMDRHLSQEEDIFAECKPNKLPFIFRRITQPLIATVAFGVLLVIYVLVRSFLNLLFQNIIDFVFIFGFIGLIGFILYELYQAILDTKTNYYVIATDGIHILYYDKTVRYTCVLYKDLKSVVLKEGPFGVGDIYLTEKTEKLPETFIERFMYKKNGLIGIDEADKVFDVIRQIAIQDNDNIFFADANSDVVNTSYFKDVKKYDRELKQNKNESLISMRNERNN